MAGLPLEAVVIAISLRYDPDPSKNGYKVSGWGLATVGGWHTPLAVLTSAIFADADSSLPDIGLQVSASALNPFIDKAKIQAMQRATKAARKTVKERRRL